jgi:hypothetical protein
MFNDRLQRRLLEAEKEARNYNHKYYNLLAEVEQGLIIARKEARLDTLIETQERLRNLYSEFMSFKFKRKK